MRPRRLRRRLALAGVAAVVGAFTITTSVAEAAPSVCGALDDSPTVATVETLVYTYVSAGYTPYESGEYIADQVITRCPEYLPVLYRFIDAYAPSTASFKGALGGRVS